MPCTRGCCETQAEHIRSVNMNPGPSSTTLMERQWQRDFPAYRALRKQGLQPRQVDGSADLAVRASNEVEIKLGKVIPNPGVRAALAEVI